MRNVPKAFWCGLCVAAACAAGIARAEAPAGAPVEQALGRTGQLAKPADRTMGDHGVLLIRSKERWDEVMGLFHGVAFEKDAHPFEKLDFTKSMIVAVFNFGDDGDAFSLKSANLTDPELPQLDCAMAYIIYKGHPITSPNYNVFCMAVPQAPAVKITLGTYHPHNGGSKAVSPETASPEFSATLREDLVDGLQLISDRKVKAKSTHAIGGQTPEILTVNDDILIHLRLDLNDKADLSTARFGHLQQEQNVWDAVYSKGYRNYAFRVTTPDGKSNVYQRAVQEEWRKNIPHAVSVKVGEPYDLGPAGDAMNYYSLHDLGLSTAAPGVYTITPVYTEGPGADEAGDQKGPKMWAGSIASSPIVVEVKAAGEAKP